MRLKFWNKTAWFQVFKSITFQALHTFPAFQRYTVDIIHLACKIFHWCTSEYTSPRIEYSWPQLFIVAIVTQKYAFFSNFYLAYTFSITSHIYRMIIHQFIEIWTDQRLLSQLVLFIIINFINWRNLKLCSIVLNFYWV